MASWCSGSSGSGALTQLIAQGALDGYLSQNATFTFWKVRYNKHTNFAMESIGQPFNTAVAFGSEAQITLNRNGDLIYFMYVVIDLPGITACDTTAEGCNLPGGQAFGVAAMDDNRACQPCSANDEAAVVDYISDNFTDATETEKERMLKNAKDKWLQAKYGAAPQLMACSADDALDCPTNHFGLDLDGVWAHWTNDIGQFLIRCARVVIGGSTVDTLYNDFLFMWEELTGKSGRRLTEMIGKRYTRAQLVCDSRQRRILYVPLPFWFTQHSGQALALASLQFHGVQIHIEFEKLSNCVVVSDSKVAVKNCSTGCSLTANDLSACLETTYVYLDNQERDRFATTMYEVLITQNQAFSMQTTNSQVRMQLNFNHPVLELMWAVRRKCHESCNNWFNYSGIDNRDPVVSAALYLNNQSRFSSKPGTWFRLVQPYQHHSNIPDCFVYVYSFALHPEDASPSGSCNFSRIDHVDLNLQLQDGLGKEQVSVMVFARNWNVLRFKEGLCGLAYAN
jgi:hypothetical protein